MMPRHAFDEHLLSARLKQYNNIGTIKLPSSPRKPEIPVDWARRNFAAVDTAVCPMKKTAIYPAKTDDIKHEEEIDYTEKDHLNSGQNIVNALGTSMIAKARLEGQSYPRGQYSHYLFSISYSDLHYPVFLDGVRFVLLDIDPFVSLDSPSSLLLLRLKPEAASNRTRCLILTREAASLRPAPILTLPPWSARDFSFSNSHPLTPNFSPSSTLGVFSFFSSSSSSSPSPQHFLIDKAASPNKRRRLHLAIRVAHDFDQSLSSWDRFSGSFLFNSRVVRQTHLVGFSVCHSSLPLPHSLPHTFLFLFLLLKSNTTAFLAAHFAMSTFFQLCFHSILFSLPLPIPSLGFFFIPPHLSHVIIGSFSSLSPELIGNSAQIFLAMACSPPSEIEVPRMKRCHSSNTMGHLDRPVTLLWAVGANHLFIPVLPSGGMVSTTSDFPRGSPGMVQSVTCCHQSVLLGKQGSGPWRYTLLSRFRVTFWVPIDVWLGVASQKCFSMDVKKYRSWRDCSGSGSKDAGSQWRGTIEDDELGLPDNSFDDSESQDDMADNSVDSDNGNEVRPQFTLSNDVSGVRRYLKLEACVDARTIWTGHRLYFEPGHRPSSDGYRVRDVASTSGSMDWGMTREGSVSSSSYPNRAARDHSLLSRFGGDSCGTALMTPSGVPAESLEESHAVVRRIGRSSYHQA
ncbi:uncharacterized protein CLUP02_05140 [Colletotrichum lupini]|uniref:Uncharacterized protein n=1 Tax=Colletotrichum lupini TaxID=145971 RepID=A0A9Q8SMK5_9PEZI|nr:uncharacterized protein CLUP02_05140 [Colletotrichum lupini]UQC79660.1 hypothetical protein CLUP02_05140 [Colletotrichum lupini]